MKANSIVLDRVKKSPYKEKVRFTPKGVQLKTTGDFLDGYLTNHKNNL